MPEPLSLDLRKRIVAAYKRGGFSYLQVAELFDVGEASVSRLLARDRDNGGDLTPDPHGGGNPPRIPAEQFGKLRAVIREHPDATRDDLCRIWKKRYNVVLSVASMGRTLRDAGITRKKGSSARWSSSDRTS